MMASLPRSLLLVLLLALAACKHPLEIDGQGDIVERNNGYRGCSLEEFEAGFTRCTHNEVFQDEADPDTVLALIREIELARNLLAEIVGDDHLEKHGWGSYEAATTILALIAADGEDEK